MDKVAVNTCVSSMSKFQIAVQERDESVRDATTVMCQIKVRQTILSDDLQSVQKGLGNNDKTLVEILETLERIDKKANNMRERYEKMNE